MNKKIYLIDWNNFIYRMFFALPEFSTKDWKIVNAIFWMAKFFVWQLTKEKPDYILFIKDAKWKNFRHNIYSNYKATRDRMPDNLKQQIQDIENMIKNMWIDIIDIPWYEADDVIWTLAKKLWKNKDYEIDILTWDKDLYSLVSDNIKIYDTMKKKKFWPKETFEKFWIKPKFIIDYLAIVWDKSDNIPWISWFWPKKAIPLINYIWDIEKIYKIAEKIKSWDNLKKYINNKKEKKELEKIFKWKTFDKLIWEKENAILSKRLATIKKDVELKDFNIENYKFFPEKLLNKKIITLFKKLEFNSLLSASEEKEFKKWKNLKVKVNIIWDKKWLKDLENKIKEYKQITLDTETTSIDIIKANLVAISIYLDEKNIYYINLLHNWPKVKDEDLKLFLKKLLSSNRLIIWHNLKYDLEIIELFLKWYNEKKDNQKQMIINF